MTFPRQLWKRVAFHRQVRICERHAAATIEAGRFDRRGPARTGMVDANDADETMTRRSLKRTSEFSRCLRDSRGAAIPCRYHTRYS
jgi:hypothetical protein